MLAILLTSVERSVVVLLKLVVPLITVIKDGMRVLEGATVGVEVRMGPMMDRTKTLDAINISHHVGVNVFGSN